MGNMISDFVKGRKKLLYPLNIQKGITLHRFIDKYTDEHASTRAAKELFRPAYRLYSGALVDVLFDHYLATHPEEFNEQSLLHFTQKTYATLDRFTDWMPDRFAAMFPYMKEQNWLYNYRNRWGAGKSLGGVVRRAAYLTESDTAFQIFEDNYAFLQSCFHAFWEDIKPVAREKFENLLSQPTL